MHLEKAGANAGTPAALNASAGDGIESLQAASPAGDMSSEDFRRFGHEIIDWIADYWEHPERYPVSPDVEPRALVDSLPASGPESGESMERILADFEKQVLPHVTHWNHPGFMAYFVTTGSTPGVSRRFIGIGLEPDRPDLEDVSRACRVGTSHTTLAGGVDGIANRLVRHDTRRSVDWDHPCGHRGA